MSVHQADCISGIGETRERALESTAGTLQHLECNAGPSTASDFINGRTSIISDGRLTVNADIAPQTWVTSATDSSADQERPKEAPLVLELQRPADGNAQTHRARDGPSRRRTRACQHCAMAKARCTKRSLMATCNRCSERGLPCVLPCRVSGKRRVLLSPALSVDSRSCMTCAFQGLACDRASVNPSDVRRDAVPQCHPCQRK